MSWWMYPLLYLLFGLITVYTAGRRLAWEWSDELPEAYRLYKPDFKLYDQRDAMIWAMVCSVVIPLYVWVRVSFFWLGGYARPPKDVRKEQERQIRERKQEEEIKQLQREIDKLTLENIAEKERSKML